MVIALAQTVMRNPIVKLTNCDGDETSVLATVEGPGAQKWAENDMSISGSSWETPHDMPNVAYAMIADYPGLVNDLRAEGYKLDVSEYCPADDDESDTFGDDEESDDDEESAEPALA